MNIKSQRLLYRIWFYFRRGFGNYIAFGVSFLNFIVIQYKLLVENTPLLKSIFNNIVVFSLISVVILGVICVLIGWWDTFRGSFVEEVEFGVMMNPRWKWLEKELADIKKKLNDLNKNAN